MSSELHLGQVIFVSAGPANSFLGINTKLVVVELLEATVALTEIEGDGQVFWYEKRVIEKFVDAKGVGTK